MLISQFLDEAVIAALSEFIKASADNSIISSSTLIAQAFESSSTFVPLVVPCSAERDRLEKKLVTSFHNNLNLLVQKTWIEKYDETLKEQVQYRLENFFIKFSQKNYADCYGEFLSILHDVVYLMFGTQAKKDDFAEYALRIDPEFGIFWWYVTSLPLNNTWSDEKRRIAIILGMIFLANY